MKIKILTSTDHEELEKNINEFLQNSAYEISEITFTQSEDDFYVHQTAYILYK